MTTNEQIASWIEIALENPNVIEDFFYVYPCSETFRERELRAVRERYDPVWTPVLENMALKYPIRPKHPKFDSQRPAACADVLALALIGRFNNDLDAAYRVYVETTRSRHDLKIWEIYGLLLDLPQELCHTLLSWHSDCVAGARELAQRLRTNNW